MADTSSLNELFERDPFKYSEQDIDTIIARFRDARAQFNLASNPGRLTGPKAKAAPDKTVADLLSELGM